MLGVRPLPLVGGLVEEAIRLTGTAHGAALGSQAQAGGAHGAGGSPQAGPSASTTPGVWASPHKPAAERPGAFRVDRACGVTRGLWSFTFARDRAGCVPTSVLV